MTSPVLFPRSTPAAQGLPAEAILGFIERAEQNISALHSLMLVRHGHVVAEGWWSPYGPHIPHMLFSLSKSFTSTAVGLAVAEGRLTVQDRVLSFFPEDAPAQVSENLAAMRVRDLLSMSSGHADDTFGPMHEAADGNFARAFLALPVQYVPGTHFLYNTGATYMCSAIVQKLTGQTLMDYLTPRLFAPLGIEGMYWDSCPRGINLGGTGLHVRTEDIARFGQLYLQKGLWQGQRLLNEAWVEEATSRQIYNDRPDPDWHQGYGYQFWRCRHNAYRGDGAFGQYCVVMPEQDAVLAITSGVPNMQTVLDLVWEILLPAMGSAPLAEDSTTQQRLTAKLSSLALAPLPARAPSPQAAQWSGKRYVFPENEQGLQALTVAFGAEQDTTTVEDASGTHSITCGHGAWHLGMSAFEQGLRRRPGASVERRVAASGAWSDAETYEAKLCFYETPFLPSISLRFAGDSVTYQFTPNVGFGPTERPALVAKLACC